MEERFADALRRVDEINGRDPRSEQVEGVETPREVAYSQRMLRWVDRLDPKASEALRLAAYCQHLARFEMPRSSFPDGRTGYLRWRRACQREHAERSSRVLEECGYGPELRERVRSLVMKRDLRRDTEAQTLEDAACLCFLERDLEPFTQKHSAEKIVEILRKTWRKMSPVAREAARDVDLGVVGAHLVRDALSADARSGGSG